MQAYLSAIRVSNLQTRIKYYRPKESAFEQLHNEMEDTREQVNGILNFKKQLTNMVLQLVVWIPAFTIGMLVVLIKIGGYYYGK